MPAEYFKNTSRFPPEYVYVTGSVNLRRNRSRASLRVRISSRTKCRKRVKDRVRKTGWEREKKALPKSYIVNFHLQSAPLSSTSSKKLSDRVRQLVVFGDGAARCYLLDRLSRTWIPSGRFSTKTQARCLLIELIYFRTEISIRRNFLLQFSTERNSS